MQKNIAYKFINLDLRDFHMHTSSFSDGMMSVDELVRFAWDIGLKEIIITDHSQATQDSVMREWRPLPSGRRWWLKRWKNVFNDVKVWFWVEADLLDEDGNMCFDIQSMESDFNILSAHRKIYSGRKELVTEATIKAIEKYHEKIAFIGHPCNNADFWEYYDIEKLCEVANAYKIPLEFNAVNLLIGKMNIEKLYLMLEKADRLYLNSDAHTLYELKEARPFALKFLQENGYIDL